MAGSVGISLGRGGAEFLVSSKTWVWFGFLGFLSAGSLDLFSSVNVIFPPYVSFAVHCHWGYISLPEIMIPPLSQGGCSSFLRCVPLLPVFRSTNQTVEAKNLMSLFVDRARCSLFVCTVLLQGPKKKSFLFNSVYFVLVAGLSASLLCGLIICAVPFSLRISNFNYADMQGPKGLRFIFTEDPPLRIVLTPTGMKISKSKILTIWVDG